MEFSAFLVFAVWTSSLTYVTFGKERERAMVFPDYYFFAERRLVNHTIDEKRVKNLDDCELFCYLNDDCVSLNYKKDPGNDKTGYNCQLNNATHLKYDSDLTTDAKFYYRGSKNACDKSPQCQNNATCQSGFTSKGYQCLCPSGYKGEHCEKDVDECQRNHSCHENANCTNTIGSHVCNCQPGYTGNGQNCTDIDECSEAHSLKMNECHPNASCINTQGSYKCSCNPTFIRNGLECKADPCHYYSNLSEANRNTKHRTPTNGQQLCDRELPEGWYRFVGAAGTKMPTTHVSAYSCGTAWSGWLDGKHPTVEDSEVQRQICFSARSKSSNLCKSKRSIFVKNCGLYYIYELFAPKGCPKRYCGTDEK